MSNPCEKCGSDHVIGYPKSIALCDLFRVDNTYYLCYPCGHQQSSSYIHNPPAVYDPDNVDMHLGCPNWPNCDDAGCGEA